MSVGRGGSDPVREGGVSSGRNEHLDVRGIATCYSFWFVTNPVAPQLLDCNSACFCPYLVVSSDD